MESPARERSKSWKLGFGPSSLRNLLGSASASKLSDPGERAGNAASITLPNLFSSKSAKDVRGGSFSASRLGSGQVCVGVREQNGTQLCMVPFEESICWLNGTWGVKTTVVLNGWTDTQIADQKVWGEYHSH